MARPILTPTQCRMARAALQWSLEEAAAAAGVSRRTILRLENDQRDILPDKIGAIRRAYEAAGIRFLDDGPDTGAVAPPPFRAPPPR
jgi:transcriptional regulator with XRE-family HTH domain